MEITVENFEERFEVLSKSIQTAEFIAFDTEFSGSHSGISDKPHEYDSFDDKYKKNASSVKKFIAFQIGITTFMWSSLKSKYIGRPFNFWVYPRSLLKDKTHWVSVSTINDYIFSPTLLTS